MPVVTNLWEVKLENCTAWKYGTARRFSLNLVMIQAKATLKEEGWGKLTENALAVDALVVGLGSKNSSTLCNNWILGHETHRSLYPMRKVDSQ